MKPTYLLCLFLLGILITGCGSGNEKQDKESADAAKNGAGADASKGQAGSVATCSGVTCPEGNICVNRKPDGSYTVVGFNTESGVERCCIGGVCAADATRVQP